VSYVPNVRVLAHEIAVGPWTPLLEQRNWFVRFAICAAASGALAALPLGHGLPQLVARAAVASLVYAGVMIPFVASGTLGIYFRQLVVQPLQVWTARLRAGAA
jgi:hypothetical protein